MTHILENNDPAKKKDLTMLMQITLYILAGTPRFAWAKLQNQMKTIS